MIKNRKLDHIGLACTDAAASAAWYQNVLGFHIVGAFQDEAGKDVFFVGNTDESVIYEIYTEDLPAQLQGKIDHIAYVSGDVEADYRYCLEQGYEICTDGIEGIRTFWKNGVRYFKIKSATGEEVEFLQKI